MSFEGQPIDGTSSPMRYDASTRTFEIYSEDNALLGMRQIEVRGYFRDYPSIKSDLPNLTTTIEILDPCL